jgi:hypothetical protein
MQGLPRTLKHVKENELYKNINNTMQKNQPFLQKVLHIPYPQRGCFRSAEVSSFFNLLNFKRLYCQCGKPAHSLKMSTGHFLKALPSHKLINEGTSVIFRKTYVSTK